MKRKLRKAQHGQPRVWIWAGIAMALVGVLPLVTAAASGVSARRGSIDSFTAGHLLYRDRVKDVPGHGRTSAGVGCPPSHPHVTGGGIFTDGGSAEDGRLAVEVGSTAPFTVGTESSWLADANNETGAPAEMTVSAICKKHGRFHYPVAEKPNPGGPIQNGVSCRPGTKLTGGGVETHGDQSTRLSSTEPADGPDQNLKRDDKWIGAATGGDLTVTAVCAKSGTAGSYRYVHTARKGVPTHDLVVAHAACPSKTHVTGGGIDITGTDTGAVKVKQSFPLEDGGWSGGAINETGGTEKMQVFAICKR
jgi:hypothetical protein